MSGFGKDANRLSAAIRLTRLATGAILLRPLTYLILYLSSIVSFAWLYDTRGDAVFYAPYAKLEQISRRDKAAVEMNISKAISEANPYLRSEGPGWTVDDLRVSELVIDEGGDFSFTLNFLAEHFTSNEEDLSLGGPTENIRVSRWRLILPNEHRICRPVTLPADQMRRPILEAVFRQTAFLAPMLCWDGKAEIQFNEMRSGWSGNPKAFSGSYWRMLYLSAITITSVGYGDIVPISNTARLLCGLEAVLGWVIAGFFLSVVTIRRKGEEGSVA